jgi:hypothetical protein
MHILGYFFSSLLLYQTEKGECMQGSVKDAILQLGRNMSTGMAFSSFPPTLAVNYFHLAVDNRSSHMPIPGATTLAFTNPQKDEGD